MRKNILSLLGFCVFCACTENAVYNPPAFPVEKKLAGTCLSDDLLISYAYDMRADSDYIYLLALADNKWVQVYDRHTGEHLGGYVGQGQGPGEVSVGESLTLSQDKKQLSVYDQAQRRLVTYTILREGSALTLSFVRGMNLNEMQGAIRNVWPLESTLLVNGQLGSQDAVQKRFQLLKEDKVVDVYNDFPVEAREQQLTFLSPQVCFSPSLGKMAVGTLYGGILEVFRLADGGISLDDSFKFYEPKVNVGTGNIEPDAGMRYGFSAMCGTEELIYSVLIGEEDPNKLNSISVFDWKGNGVFKYHTDQMVFKLACTEDVPDKLYALTFEPSEGFSLYEYVIND